MSVRIFKKALALAGAVTMVAGTAKACDSDNGKGPLTPQIVIVGDGNYSVGSLKSKRIKADSPGRSCLWWIWYDIKSQPGKGIILSKGNERNASIDLGKKYIVKGSGGQIRKFKPTSFTTDGCGRWLAR